MGTIETGLSENGKAGVYMNDAVLKYGWRSFLRWSWLPLMLGVGTYAQEEATSRRADREESSAKQVAVDDSVPGANGIVFIDGTYIEPPYAIERRGLELIINDRPFGKTVGASGEGLSGEPDAVLYRLERQRQQYEDRLLDGYTYFFFTANAGAAIECETYVVAFGLPRIVAVLRSNRSIDEKLAVLRQAGWQYQASEEQLKDLASRFCAPPAFDERIQQLAQSLMRIEEFGEKVGEPVGAGFVFVDGRYVDAPYVVVRRGLAVFVNDELIEPPVRWPVERVMGETDPALPADVVRYSSLYDDALKDYLLRKAAYLQAHYGPDKERDLMKDTLKRLPCVKEAIVDDVYPDILHVSSFIGERVPFGLVGLRGRRIDVDRESVLARVESLRENYEGRLRRGDYYFFFHEGGRITGGADKAAELVPRMVRILSSTESSDVKVREIQRAGLNMVDEETLRRIVAGFVESPQLKRRLVDSGDAE